jgi:hypothetical protein
MPDTSPALSLPYIQPSQAQKHVTHNEALRVLDAVTQLSVISATLSSAPAAPIAGDRYLVASGANSAWVGQDQNIAVFDGNDWTFFAPSIGWRADVVGSGAQLRFDGSVWEPALPDLQNVAYVGIATTADSVNRLSVSGPASLFSHAGAGHQVKVNKSTLGDTASLLFQTGFSGRAEIGLAGDDNFSIKTSPDGITFQNALSVDATTGALHIPQGQSYFRDVLIPDDAVDFFDIPWSDPARILMWMATDVTGHSFLFSITGALSGASNFVPMLMNPAGLVNFMTGPLTGTTGPAAAITLSIDVTGASPRMYVENRLGAAQTFTFATLGK